MKKLFLAAAVALTGLLSASAAVNPELVGKKLRVNSEVTAVKPGHWYLLKNHGRNNYVKEETTAFKMRAFDGTDKSAETYAGFLFKISASTTTGKYYIESGNGKYFSLGDNSSAVSATPRDFSIVSRSAEHFYIQDVESEYIADGQETGNNFVGWSKNIPTGTGGNNCYHLIEVVPYTPAPLENDKLYTLKSLDSDYYVNMDVPGSNAKLSTTPTVLRFTKGATDDKWMIKENDQYGNTLSVSSWNCPTNTKDDYYWSIAQVEVAGATTTNPIVILHKSNLSPLPAGSAANAADHYFGFNGTPAQDNAIYTDRGPTRYAGEHCYWELIPVEENRADYVANYPAINGTDVSLTVNKVAPARKISWIVGETAPGVFTYTGAADATVGTQGTTAIAGTWRLDRVGRMDLRKANANNCANWYYDAASGRICTRSTNPEPGEGATVNDFVRERLFYLHFLRVENNEIVVTLHNLAEPDDKGFGNTTTNNDTGWFSNEPVEYRIATNSNGTEGFSLRHPGPYADGDQVYAYLNDIVKTVNGTNVGYLGSWKNGNTAKNDGGSFIRLMDVPEDQYGTSWVYEGETINFTTAALNAAKANPSVANMRALFNPGQVQINHNYDHIVAMGNALKSIVVADEQAAWTDALALATDKTQDNIDTLTEVYNQMVASLADDSFQFQSSSNANDYFGCYNGNPWRCGNESMGNRTWTFRANEGGLLLYNNYTDKYLKHPANGGVTSFTESADDASTYTIEPVVDSEGNAKFAFLTTDPRVGGYLYVTEAVNAAIGRTDNAVAANGNVEQAQWIFHATPVAEADSEFLNGTVARCGAATTDMYGDEVCQYHLTSYDSQNYADAKKAAVDAQADATADRRAAGNALKSEYAALTTAEKTFNMPVKGGFYRIYNTNGGKYLKGETNDDGKVKIEAKGTTTAEINAFNANRAFIWLYDGSGHLICMDNGKVLGKHTSAAATQSLFVAGADNASTGITLREATNAIVDGVHINGVHISASDGRWIHGHGDNDIVMCGDNNATNATNAATGYTWRFERVQYLPVAAVNGQFTAFKSPLPLDLRSQADAYTATVELGKVRKHELEDMNTLPANTPVMLNVKANATTDGAIWPIVNWSGVNFVAGTNANTAVLPIEGNELHVDYLAANAQENAVALTNGTFAAASGVLNGFTGYVVVAEGASGDMAIDLPVHSDSASGSYDDTSYKWMLNHGHGSLSKLEHGLQITFTRSGASGAQAPQRRIAQAGDNAYVADNDDVTINEDGNAVIDLTDLPKGTYDVVIPAEFFMVNGTHYTPEMNLTLTKDTDTAIEEVIIEGIVGDVYDLQGRRLGAPVKGINIIGGKKVLVK